MFANTVVDPLVVTAENDEGCPHERALAIGWVELFSVGEGENYFVVVTFGFERRDDSRQWVGIASPYLRIRHKGSRLPDDACRWCSPRRLCT